MSRRRWVYLLSALLLCAGCTSSPEGAADADPTTTAQANPTTTRPAAASTTEQATSTTVVEPVEPAPELLLTASDLGSDWVEIENSTFNPDDECDTAVNPAVVSSPDRLSMTTFQASGATEFIFEAVAEYEDADAALKALEDLTRRMDGCQGYSTELPSGDPAVWDVSRSEFTRFADETAAWTGTFSSEIAAFEGHWVYVQRDRHLVSMSIAALNPGAPAPSETDAAIVVDLALSKLPILEFPGE